MENTTQKTGKSMAIKMVILWSPSERVGTQEGVDPRIDGIRERGVQEIKDLGVDICETGTDEGVLAQLSDADAFYGRHFNSDLLKAAETLQWIQASTAGMDGFFYPELRESPVTVTNMRGIYSDVMSDHVFAFVLSFARGLHIFARRQKREEWDRTVAPVIHLGNATLGIVGLGGIGLAVAERGHTSGMRILGVDPAPKNVPDYVENVWDPENLHDMLAQSDFVAACVPHTGQTKHMIDAAALEAMKDTAILINVGRGKVIDLKALTAALEAGKLGGAGLDVLEEEPLPKGHPLWQMDNVIITPHSAMRSSYPYTEERRMDLLTENTRRFLSGEPLLNLVDKQKGYVVEPNV